MGLCCAWGHPETDSDRDRNRDGGGGGGAEGCSTNSGLLHYWGSCTCIPSTVSRNGSTIVTLGSIRQAVLSNKYGGRDILYNTDAINHIVKLIVHCPCG